MWHAVQEVTGDDAKHLAALAPGLFDTKVVGGKTVAVVGEARKHENQLEKVGPLTCDD
jgi:hypothetical protein